MSDVNVYLARHGQTAYNLERRFQGQQAVPLDDTGRGRHANWPSAQPTTASRALWCSPLLRARETADVVAARIGLEPREDARFMETDAGDWTNLLFSEVHAKSPELLAKFLAGDSSFAFPGGESFAEQEARVAAALRDVEAGPLPALVVCHGMVIRAALSSRAGARSRAPSACPTGRSCRLTPPAPCPPSRRRRGDRRQLALDQRDAV